MHFVPTFDEPDKQDSIPGVNLTIVPLGAIFIFLIFFCCKTFHWAVYDFRERDDNKELQVMTIAINKNGYCVSYVFQASALLIATWIAAGVSKMFVQLF